MSFHLEAQNEISFCIVEDSEGNLNQTFISVFSFALFSPLSL